MSFTRSSSISEAKRGTTLTESQMNWRLIHITHLNIWPQQRGMDLIFLNLTNGLMIQPIIVSLGWLAFCSKKNCRYVYEWFDSAKHEVKPADWRWQKSRLLLERVALDKIMILNKKHLLSKTHTVSFLISGSLRIILRATSIVCIW